MDFETILKKSEIKISDKTSVYQEHVPCGFCYIVLDDKSEVIYTKVYRGDKCIEVFLKTLFNATEKLFLMLNKKCDMDKLSEDEELQFNESEICHICGKTFKTTEIKVKF